VSTTDFASRGPRLGGTAAEWEALDDRNLARLEDALGVTHVELLESDADEAASALISLALYDETGLGYLEDLFRRAVGKARAAAVDLHAGAGA
jgi:hypothetical protein